MKVWTRREVDQAPLCEVLEPARRRDEDLGALGAVRLGRQRARRRTWPRPRGPSGFASARAPPSPGPRARVSGRARALPGGIAPASCARRSAPRTRASCRIRSATGRGRRVLRAHREGRAPGSGTDARSSLLRARRRQAARRRARGRTSGHVVRLLSGFETCDLETPEGGTRSSSHRTARLPIRAHTVALGRDLQPKRADGAGTAPRPTSYNVSCRTRIRWPRQRPPPSLGGAVQAADAPEKVAVPRCCSLPRTDKPRVKGGA